jgi:nucleoid-associated protein YgaU
LEQENPIGIPGFQVTPQPGGSLPPTGGWKGNQRIHIVKEGDWLSKIALNYYGDALKYDVIHKANLQTIGPNPNIIKPGQQLIIP